MKLSKPLLYGVMLLMVANVVALFLNYSNSSEKVAYVRSQELVYGYLGMKQAQNDFQLKKVEWEAQLDTLESDYRKALSAYQVAFPSLSENEKKEREKLLTHQQNNFYKYSEVIQKKMEEEEQKMLEGVLNQVNSFTEEYGRKQGYTLILGTTASGSVLYGDQGIDITEELLDVLNSKYQG